MSLPPAIIFINADINSTTQSTLASQLYVNDIMAFSEFNNRISVDPNYADNVHLQSLRILVILPTFRDFTNRNLADVVLFYNQGQVTVEKNNFGPPGLSLPIARLNMYALLRYNNSPYVVILPTTVTRPACSSDDGNFPFGTSTVLRDPNHAGIGGIVADQLADTSGVYCANPDNEYNNPDFINRK